MSARTSEHPVDPRQWVGRTQQRSDPLCVRAARFMQATLDRDASLKEGDALPPLWHWLYFLEAEKLGALGDDAHPRKGGFLPPVDLPRRMWAGGRFRFHAPLVLGRDASMRSTIKAVKEKQGRTGRLCFVTIAHDVFQGESLAIAEEQDIVYCENPAGTPNTAIGDAAGAPESRRADFSRPITPSEILLFRYSALTFNGHRIHYDADYARSAGGYEGLVFHGPLLATLLLDLACEQTGKSPATFAYRGLAPIAGMATFHMEGRHAKTRPEDALELWARRADGTLAMSATAHMQTAEQRAGK